MEILNGHFEVTHVMEVSGMGEMEKVKKGVISFVFF